MDATPLHKGIHPVLEQEHLYIFIDACMQAWPDADYAIAHRHGVTAYAVTAFHPWAELPEALEGMMFWHLVARRYPNLGIAWTADDIRHAKREGRALFVLASQGGDFIGNALHRIEAFYRLGLRMLIPAYSRTNAICGGCLDRADGGLTSFGELVVEECNHVGLLLDCSHVGKRSSLELIERSAVPIVFSHSNPRRLVDNPRNIDDEQILACAARSGVVGLAPWGPLVMKPGSRTRPTLDDFVEHIDYVAQLTGSVDHIGIGTDMSLGTYPDHEHDPWGEPAYAPVTREYDQHVTADVRSPMRAIDGFSSYPEVLNLIDRLQRRGYREEDVRKILGGNLLRLFEQVWR